MIFVRGKFYQDGIEVPLEFGNKEQSKFMDKIRELEGDGILCLGDSLVCTCGETVHKAKYKMGECDKCGNVFKWSLYQDEVPIVKLVHRERK